MDKKKAEAAAAPADAPSPTDTLKTSFRVRRGQMVKLRRTVAHAQRSDLSLSIDRCVREAIDDKIAALERQYGQADENDSAPRRGPPIRLE